MIQRETLGFLFFGILILQAIQTVWTYDVTKRLRKLKAAQPEFRWVESYNDKEVAFPGQIGWEGDVTRYKLQQKWEITENGLVRYEWRDVGVSSD